jgi:23S rRNA pseudouridine955/2504/2580 synthase
MTTFRKNQVNFYTVTHKDEGQRLDNLLIKLLKGVPKSYIYRIIRSKEVKINNTKADASYKTKIDDIIRIPPVAVAAIADKKFIPAAVFPVLYEDDYFLIIDKPDGVACHGGSGVSFGVIEQLRQTYVTKFLELAHRLDRDTSGILILAKKRQALTGIQEIIKNGQMTKYYVALTIGKWRDTTRNVKEPLFKYLLANGERRVRVDPAHGKFAHTIFSVMESFKGYTLVKADIRTGRTHQIRVHSQYIGYPIAGDDKYGDSEANKYLAKLGFKRMFLHAHLVEFIHPITKEKVLVKSPLFPKLQSFIKELERE